MATKKIIRKLISHCQTGSIEQKAAAIVELEEMRAKEAVPALLELLDFPDAAIRASVTYALGSLADLKDRQVGRALLPLLKDPDELVRANTAESLGLLQFARAERDLVRTLKSDKKSLVRVCAAEALGLLKDPSSLPALIEATGTR